MYTSIKLTGEEYDEIVRITEAILNKQRKKDAVAVLQEEKNRKKLEKDIAKMNAPIKQSKITSYMKAEQALIDLEDQTDELSEEDDDFEDEPVDLDDTENDADELETVLSYLSYAAHNIQLVVKDGLKLDDSYSVLIKKVSKNIVCKSKASTYIAAKIRILELTLQKSVITRWNSILFMIRSVLRLTDQDFVDIRNKMTARTEKQKLFKKNFKLERVEREMLVELRELLEMFEFVTNEFQCKNYNI